VPRDLRPTSVSLCARDCTVMASDCTRARGQSSRRFSRAISAVAMYGHLADLGSASAPALRHASRVSCAPSGPFHPGSPARAVALPLRSCRVFRIALTSCRHTALDSVQSDTQDQHFSDSKINIALTSANVPKKSCKLISHYVRQRADADISQVLMSYFVIVCMHNFALKCPI
jgi:hypothetical protein